MNEQDDRGAWERGSNELMVPGIILAVADHRRRIARLLGGLDYDRRATVERAVQALEDGSLDAATMLMQFRERAATRSRDDDALTGAQPRAVTTGALDVDTSGGPDEDRQRPAP